MAYYSGKEASVQIGTSKVIQCRNWRLNLTSETLDVTCLGDTYKKEVPNVNQWTATMEAFFDPADTNGQAVLHDAYQNGTKITNLKLYLNGSKYWTPDTNTDPDAGCYITGLTINQQQSSLATAEFTVRGYGPGKWV